MADVQHAEAEGVVCQPDQSARDSGSIYLTPYKAYGAQLKSRHAPVDTPLAGTRRTGARQSARGRRRAIEGPRVLGSPSRAGLQIQCGVAEEGSGVAEEGSGVAEEGSGVAEEGSGVATTPPGLPTCLSPIYYLRAYPPFTCLYYL